MPCKLCGADQFRPWLVGVPQLGSRTPSRFAIERCEGCGLLQTRPEPSPEELREAYGSAYTWKSNTGLASSLSPGLDPLVERERTLAGHSHHPAALALRRLLYLCLVWICTPLTLLEAAARAGGCMTVFARRAA
jgi:hypothetical protein